EDGTILAVEDSFLADVGAYPIEGEGLTLNTVNHFCAPYRVANFKSAGKSVVTNKTLNGAYRGAGRPEANFVMERLMDLGARRLGIDPADLRRRNLVRPADMPYKPGLIYKDGMPIAYLPAVSPASSNRPLSLLRYDEWRARQKEQKEGARRLGIGVSCYAQGSGIGPYEGATVRVDPSGKGYGVIGVTAQGQGHATTLAQIAASRPGPDLRDRVGRQEAVSVGHGQGRQRRHGQLRPRRGADRARGEAEGAGGGRRAARGGAGGHPHRARPGFRGRRAEQKHHAGASLAGRDQVEGAQAARR